MCGKQPVIIDTLGKLLDDGYRFNLLRVSAKSGQGFR